MNKRILTVAVAALALAACSKNETVEVAGNRAIEFGSFVNNVTRTVNDVTSEKLTFYVYGNYGDTEGNGTTTVFANDKFEWAGSGTATGTEAYWQANKYYNFGAYSDGNEALQNVTFSEAGVMAITDYTVGANDLVMATPLKYQTDSDVSDEAVQALSFSHLLSKVKFTFTSKYAEGYTVTVSDLKFTAAKTGAYTSSTNTWGSTQNGEYGYTISPFTSQTTGGGVDECYVMPQDNSNLNVTFTVNVTDGGDYNETKNFNGSLRYVNAWLAGYAYNYTVEIDGETMEENADNIIKFSVTVDSWQNYTNTAIDPEVVPGN